MSDIEGLIWVTAFAVTMVAAALATIKIANWFYGE